MEASPPASETIVTEPEPEPEPEADPVTEFKKGKAKREAKRKEVIIREYVPPAPAAVVEPKVEVPSAESIADRVLEMLAARQEEEKPKPKRAAPKKTEPTPPPSPAAAKYFGWC
jgi:hypothetical protein